MIDLEEIKARHEKWLRRREVYSGLGGWPDAHEDRAALIEEVERLRDALRVKVIPPSDDAMKWAEGELEREDELRRAEGAQAERDRILGIVRRMRDAAGAREVVFLDNWVAANAREQSIICDTLHTLIEEIENG